MEWNVSTKSGVVESLVIPDIVKVEYFNSVDQGYDNCSTEILTASADSEWSFTIPPGIVPFGSDTIYLRVKTVRKVGGRRLPGELSM